VGGLGRTFQPGAVLLRVYIGIETVLFCSFFCPRRAKSGVESACCVLDPINWWPAAGFDKHDCFRSVQPWVRCRLALALGAAYRSRRLEWSRRTRCALLPAVSPRAQYGGVAICYELSDGQCFLGKQRSRTVRLGCWPPQADPIRPASSAQFRPCWLSLWRALEYRPLAGVMSPQHGPAR